MIETPIILIAEDDDDQYELTSSALGPWRTKNQLRRVTDGQELLEYLHRRGEYDNAKLYPMPQLVLLDLKMPNKGGLEALAEIKAHPSLRLIPVAVLSHSHEEKDVQTAYDLGANSFIYKHLNYDSLEKSFRVMLDYWFKAVELPSIAGSEL